MATSFFEEGTWCAADDVDKGRCSGSSAEGASSAARPESSVPRDSETVLEREPAFFDRRKSTTDSTIKEIESTVIGVKTRKARSANEDMATVVSRSWREGSRLS